MIELLDIFDQHGNPTGRTEEKVRAHDLGLWHRAAHILVMNSQGELLMQLRAACKTLLPNWWDPFVGGHISAGETYAQGAVRELNEELGIDIPESELKKLFSYKYARNELLDINPLEHDEIFLVNLDLPIDRFVMAEEEVAQLKYMPWRKLVAMSDEELYANKIIPHPYIKNLGKYLEAACP